MLPETTEMVGKLMGQKQNYLNYGKYIFLEHEYEVLLYIEPEDCNSASTKACVVPYIEAVHIVTQFAIICLCKHDKKSPVILLNENVYVAHHS